MKTRWLVGLVAAVMLSGPALAAEKPLKLGVLTDMSSVYADSAGLGSVAAVELAVEDAGGMAFGQPIEVISADFQMKADIALAIAREWYDTQGVDAIFDVIGSGNALAINNLAKELQRTVFVSAAAADAIGGADCNGYALGWLYNFNALIRTVVYAQLDKGYKTWFLLLPDGSYGKLVQAQLEKFLPSGGGEIVGTVTFPYETQDFSSYLLQAQASGAQLIVSTSGGSANINIMKQAREFGLPNEQQKVAGLVDLLTDVKSAGLEVMQGQTYVTSFYWDFDDRTREFARRFEEKMGKKPTNNQAGAYSAALWYIKAVNATNSRDPEAIRTWLATQTIDDLTTRNGRLRIGGRLVRDMYLVQAKTPAESKGEWDYYTVLETISPEQAFGPDSESGCPMDAK